MIRILIGAALLILAGCASPPPPAVLTLNIIGSLGQNPDPTGQGTTVAVQLYQLTATGKFQSTDVYSLMAHESSVLGTDESGASEQFLLTPGQHLTETRPLKPGISAVGIAVLFRDINHSTWKLVKPVAANGPTALTLRINGLTATLQ
jgi:type VI secretion system protein VasD